MSAIVVDSHASVEFFFC